MSAKNLMLFKLFYRYTTKTSFVETRISVLTQRQLSYWNQNRNVRGLKWSSFLRKNKNNEDDIADRTNPKKTDNSSKSTVRSGQPVLNIIAPEIRDNEETKTSDAKGVVQNSNSTSISLTENQLKKSKNFEKDVENREIQMNGKDIGKKRVKLDLAAQSLERNFITPFRAMSEFLLKPSDLENLPRTRRRSPYECEPPITVYWRKDVEAKAMEIWGSKEALNMELLKRDIERKRYQQRPYKVELTLFSRGLQFNKPRDTYAIDGPSLGSCLSHLDLIVVITSDL